MWRRVILVACVLSVALLPSCAEGANGSGAASSPSVEHQASSKPTTTPAPTRMNDPASDASLLSGLLGATMPRCPKWTPRTNVTCGQLLAISAELVGYVGVALGDMPKTAEYEYASQAVSTFQTTYDTIKSPAVTHPSRVVRRPTSSVCSLSTCRRSPGWVCKRQSTKSVRRTEP